MSNAAKTVFAAVGNDGTRPVVWGLGATEEEAIADAADAVPSEELAVHAITRKQSAEVEAGNVSWPIGLSGVRAEREAEEIIEAAGMSGGIDEVRRLAEHGWPDNRVLEGDSPALRADIQAEAKRVVASVDEDV